MLFCWKFIDGCVASLSGERWPKYFCDPESTDFGGAQCPPGCNAERLVANCVRYVRIDPGDKPIVGEMCVVRVNLRLL